LTTVAHVDGVPYKDAVDEDVVDCGNEAVELEEMVAGEEVDKADVDVVEVAEGDMRWVGWRI